MKTPEIGHLDQLRQQYRLLKKRVTFLTNRLDSSWPNLDRATAAGLVQERQALKSALRCIEFVYATRFGTLITDDIEADRRRGEFIRAGTRT